MRAHLPENAKLLVSNSSDALVRSLSLSLSLSSNSLSSSRLHSRLLISAHAFFFFTYSTRHSSFPSLFIHSVAR
jgi:hypothetical protein